jgi:hypothetical protein
VKLSKVLCSAFLAGSLACLPGCSKKTGASSSDDNPQGLSFPKMGKALSNSPEMKINELHTPQQRATFLQDLGNDSTFNPKLHKDMLEKYSKDADTDTAAAAKALLERAQ